MQLDFFWWGGGWLPAVQMNMKSYLALQNEQGNYSWCYKMDIESDSARRNKHRFRCGTAETTWNQIRHCETKTKSDWVYQNQIQCYKTNTESNPALANEHRIRFAFPKHSDSDWGTTKRPWNQIQCYQINRKSDLALPNKHWSGATTNPQNQIHCYQTHGFKSKQQQKQGNASGATILKWVPQGFFPKTILHAALSERRLCDIRGSPIKNKPNTLRRSEVSRRTTDDLQLSCTHADEGGPNPEKAEAGEEGKGTGCKNCPWSDSIFIWTHLWTSCSCCLLG